MTEFRKERESKAALDSETLEALLNFLGSDQQQAAAQYQALHHRLCRLLEWRGARYPEDLADEVMNRMARRLNDGVKIEGTDPYKYLSGIAYRVLHEEYRQAERSSRVLGEAGRFEAQTTASTEEAILAERRMVCLEKCLDALSSENRELVLEYYKTGGAKLHSHRRELAGAMGVTAQALRLRTHRIRVGLEKCVANCMNGPTN